MPRAIVESTPEEEEESETEQSSRGAGPSSKRGAAAANADEDQSEDADEMDVDEGGEGEGEDEVDDDAEGEEGEEEVDVDGEEEEEEEEEEEAASEPEEAYSAPSRSRRSKASSVPSRAAKSLKITLKLPHKTTRGRRARVVESTDPSEPPSRDVESEDEDAEGEEEDEDDEEVMPGSSSRNLTARQAVLASVVDSSHVSLDDTAPSRKKKQLNEAELALRREETARKRKHMSEKKLEDEKAETINRLLKKQSRPRNKRNALATADDRTPATQTNAAGTPDRDEETGEIAPIPIEIPTMYRWISTSRPIFTPEESDKDQPPVSEPRMTLSFSVPLDALPEASSENASASGASMDVDTPSRKMTPHCVAPGCDRISKYRLRNDFLRGVCGIEHLKLLEQAAKAR